MIFLDSYNLRDQENFSKINSNTLESINIYGDLCVRLWSLEVITNRITGLRNIAHVWISSLFQVS